MAEFNPDSIFQATVIKSLALTLNRPLSAMKLTKKMDDQIYQAHTDGHPFE